MLKIITEGKEWRESLRNLRHDWYHTWDYHQLAMSNGEGSPILLCFDCEFGDICLPLLLRDLGGGYFDATSVYGYAGPLSTEGMPLEEFSNFLGEIRKWSLSSQIVSIFSRLNTCIDDLPHELNEIADINSETVVVDLTISLDEQRKKYRKNYRNLINKLVKSDFICNWSNSSEELEEFIDIYNSTMTALDANNYYFFDKTYYNSLFDSCDFDVRIYSCYLDGIKVCTGLFVFCGEIVQYHLSGTVEQYKNHAPTRLMLDTVRQDATKLGYKTFHLGGGVSDGRDSLFNFKFGFSKDAINFRVLKLITNKAKYAELSGISLDELGNHKDGFFPLYRQNKLN